MQLTKLGHACVRVRKDDRTLVIDGKCTCCQISCTIRCKMCRRGLYMPSCSNRCQVRIFKTLFTLHAHFHIQSIQIN